MVFTTIASTAFINTVSDFAFVALGIVGIIGVIGAVSAYFYKGRADALINLQKEEITVLKDSNQRLTDTNKKLVEQRTEFILEQKRMRTEIKTLRGLITQPKQLNALAKTMAMQHTAVIDKLTDIAEGLVATANNGEK